MTEFAFDKVHVVNRALPKLGLPASYSIDDESTLGGIVDAAWLDTIAEVMTAHDWSVFRETRKAMPISGTPSNGWTYGFTLPADRVGQPVAVLTNVVREEYLRSFMLEGGKLYTNVPECWVRVRVMQDPQYWDSAFVAAFSIALASHLAVPLKQDTDDRDQLHALAFGEPRENGGGGMFGKLITLDRAAQPQGRGFLNNDPLTRARL